MPEPVIPVTKIRPRRLSDILRKISPGKWKSSNVGILSGIWRTAIQILPIWRNTLKRKRPYDLASSEKSTELYCSNILRSRSPIHAYAIFFTSSLEIKLSSMGFICPFKRT